jgi:hypothetical protein
MDHPTPALQHVRPSRGRGLPPVLAVTLVIGAFTFLFGLALGGHLAPSPSQTPTAAPFAGAEVSRELRTAYLSVIGGQGWALCAVAATITCQPAYAPSSLQLSNFGAFPLTVSAMDWAQLNGATIQPGHYVLAGPGALVAPQVTLAKIGPSGVGTIIGPDDQAVLDGVIWADLGMLEAGRYIGVVGAYELQAGGSDRQITASSIGWALGFIVGK